jgi:hypothetical protein
MRTFVVALALCLTVGVQAAAAQDSIPNAVLKAPPRDTVRLTLTDALAQAEPASEQIGIAQAGVRRAKGAVTETRSALLPQINLGVHHVFENPYQSLFPPDPTGSNPFTSTNQWRLGGSASISLFNLSQWARLSASRAATRVTELQLTQQQSLTILTVASAYYDAAKKGLSFTMVSDAGQDAQAGYGVEKLPSLVVALGARSRLRRAWRATTRGGGGERAATLPRPGSSSSSTFRSTEIVLGHHSTTARTGNAAGGRRYDAAGCRYRAARAVVRTAQEAVQQNEKLNAAAGRQWIPTMSTTMNYNRAGFSGDFIPASDEFANDWNLIAVLNWPIFTSGRILGQKRQAAANLDASRLQAKLTQEQAALDNETIYARLRKAQDNSRATASVVEQATRANEIAELRYREACRPRRNCRMCDSSWSRRAPTRHRPPATSRWHASASRCCRSCPSALPT